MLPVRKANVRNAGKNGKVPLFKKKQLFPKKLIV